MRNTVLLLTIIITISASATVSAGQYIPQPVTIDVANNRAQGDMYSARHSLSKDAYIGCGVRYRKRNDGTFFKSGFCQAGIDGETAFCSTADKEMIPVFNSLSDHSFIAFSWDPKTKECLYIVSSNQSLYLP